MGGGRGPGDRGFSRASAPHVPGHFTGPLCGRQYDDTVVVTFSLDGLIWRWVYVVGVLPALLVSWIRRSVKEPEKWSHVKDQASLGRDMGAVGELFCRSVP